MLCTLYDCCDSDTMRVTYNGPNIQGIVRRQQSTDHYPAKSYQYLIFGSALPKHVDRAAGNGTPSQPRTGGASGRGYFEA